MSRKNLLTVITTILLLATAFPVWCSITAGSSTEELVHTSSSSVLAAPSQTQSATNGRHVINQNFHDKTPSSDSSQTEDDEESQVENSSEYTLPRNNNDPHKVSYRSDDDANSDSLRSHGAFSDSYGSDSDDDSPGSHNADNGQHIHLKTDVETRASAGTWSTSSTILHRNNGQLYNSHHHHSSSSPTPFYNVVNDGVDFDEIPSGMIWPASNVTWECVKDKVRNYIIDNFG